MIRIGYPCINRTIGCTANTTFRLASYSKKRLVQTIEHNLKCLKQILEFNLKKDLLFFRIGSELVPFASHPVNTYKWESHFKKDLQSLGRWIKRNNMRISMHPGQYTVLNSPNQTIVKNAVKDLVYHTKILDLMDLPPSAKVQIHVGGVYGQKEEGIKRFLENYKKLPKNVKVRLAIENDDKSYSLKDCLFIHKKIGVPIIFDSFHHQCLNNSESLSSAIDSARKTWKKKDGVLMMDYSSQYPGEKKGRHTEHINIKDFQKFLEILGREQSTDIMLEIKDKEKSAITAKKFLLL